MTTNLAGEESVSEDSALRVLAWPGIDMGELNPYTRLLYKHIPSKGLRTDEFRSWRALLGRYDIFHIHWPEYYVAHRSTFKALVGSFGLLFLVFWCRLRGAKAIWTVHNLESHVKIRPRVEDRFWTFFTSLLDGYIALTQSACVTAQQRFPSLRSIPGFVIPHGHYRSAYPKRIGRAEARSRLRIPSHAKVLLFFGTIAGYKGVPSLVSAFGQLRDLDSVLLVAGDCPSRSELTRVTEKAAKDARVLLKIGFVPNDEVPPLFFASDLVVLPFADILNSGSAILALSFDRPILVPDKGAMPELRLSVGSDWVRTYTGDLTAPELARALRWATEPGRPINAPLDHLGWREVGAKTLEAYQTLLCGSHELVEERS